MPSSSPHRRSALGPECFSSWPAGSCPASPPPSWTGGSNRCSLTSTKQKGRQLPPISCVTRSGLPHLCLPFKLAFKITHGSFSVGRLFNQFIPSLNWCLGLFPLSAVLHMSLLNFVTLLPSSFPRSCWMEARVLGTPTAPPNLVLSANRQRVPACSGFSDSLSMRREDTALVCGIYGLDISWHLFLRFHTPSLSGKAGLSSPCCSLAPACSIPPFPLPGCADTIVWGSVANQTGGRMWDTHPITDIFVPATIIFAVKQSFLRQRSREQSWSVFGPGWRSFASGRCSPQSPGRWRSPSLGRPAVCEDAMYLRRSSWGC